MSVMQDDPRLMDHEYDGIREYDNPTPGWWHAIFAATVVFAFFYLFYWHGNPDAPTIQQSWKEDQVAEFKKIFGALGDLKPDEPTLLKMMGDSKMMDVAAGIFTTNCAICHGRDGAGIDGSACPNLTDDAWKNVKVLADTYQVVTKGANNGAMPAWENRLQPNERVIVAAYIATLRAHPRSGRAPEGTVIPPWPKAGAGASQSK
jgi:cytochrome c oxidase cbb3-type subunit 3